MYPVIILREELVCLVLLLFMWFTSRSYDMGKDSRSFTRLTIFAISHVVFDIVTVWLVNLVDANQNDKVFMFITHVAHLLFYMSAILFSKEILNYVIHLSYPKHARKLYLIGFILPALYLALLPVMGLPQYEAAEGTWSSTGTAAYVGYSIAFVYFLTALILMTINIKKISRSMSTALFPMMLILIAAVIIQAIYKPFLFTGGAVTIVTIAFFFSLENPVHVFRQKMMTDALTGMGSRHNYEMKIEELNKLYEKGNAPKYTFAFIDINRLRDVNNRYGHQEGDHYITLVATQLAEQLKTASGIYRIGGDEFIVFYTDKDETETLHELNNVQSGLKAAAVDLEYEAGVAIGFASSSEQYKTIHEIIKAADYAMYINKAEAHAKPANIVSPTGAKVNPVGLTNRLFDAVANISDSNFPFLTNLETNVTRVSATWKERFALPDEYLFDFAAIWSNYIHPEDRKNYLSEITAIKTGKKKQLDVSYRALTKGHKYIYCNSKGRVLDGSDGQPPIFAGTLTLQHEIYS